MINVVIFEHDENAESPIIVTESLILTEISDLHSANAPDGIDSTSQQMMTYFVTFM